MNARSAVLTLAAAGLATVCLVGCGSEVAPAAGADGGFDGEWTLVGGTLDGQPLELAADAPVTLMVDGSEVSGRSACNSYTGALAVDGDAVTFTGLGGTDMGCEPDVMAVETTYHEAMSRITGSTAATDTLTLTGPDVELDFEVVAPVVAAPLAGTRWLLETITTGSEPDASVSSPLAAPSTLVFNADGTFSSLTGCKEYSGTWSEIDGNLDTEVVPHPTPTCAADIVHEAGQVLDVLHGPLAAAITEDQLTLSLPDVPLPGSPARAAQGLVYRAMEPTPSTTAAG